MSADNDDVHIPGTLALEPDVNEDIPADLVRAESRLRFPPSYVIVGVYRLCTDKSLFVPAWKKCQHGLIRGLAVGSVWTFFTFALQRKFVEVFLINSPRVTGLSHEAILGYKVPFDVPTYATVAFLSTQISVILAFFLYRNIRIARERAWQQTVASRGKGADWWHPYVEEWDHPPPVNEKSWVRWDYVFASPFGRFFVTKVLLLPLHVIPLVGMAISAYLKALTTGRYLHKPYFAAKKMSPHQIALFVEERKWDYRAFGFAAALLEGLPIIGFVFTVSNRIGAAMWAHDLEKRQHFKAAQLKEKSKSVKFS